MNASLEQLTDHANDLKSQGLLEDAIAAYAKAANLYPGSAVAEHNLAAALGDIGRAVEAESHIRIAFGKGLNAPESWLVFARALLAQGKLDQARTAFEKTIELNPDMFVAHYEHAQLNWMRTGDEHAALERLDREIATHGGKVELHGTKARVLMHTSGPSRAFDYVMSMLERWPLDVKLLGIGIDAAAKIGEKDVALSLSERLLSLRRDSTTAKDLRISALLAAGRADEVFPIVQSILDANPQDQYGIAMLATTCRIVGDPRYDELYNYEEFVRSYELTAPEGWHTIDAYLGDLRSALRARHPFKSHPFENSERHGSKIADVLEIDDSTIKAFKQAITPALDAHLEYLGQGTDHLRSRNTGRWRIDGTWSVMLQPNGFHHDHVHPSGWLSSACYIDLPGAVEAPGDEGCIKFGEPGVRTEPSLSYEHLVKPAPGMLVLFPSYMWHGTIPFSGDDTRLTIAFDVVPG